MSRSSVNLIDRPDRAREVRVTVLDCAERKFALQNRAIQTEVRRAEPL
jgi:hypothetical protein